MDSGMILRLVDPQPIATTGLMAMAAGFALFLLSLLFAGKRGEKAGKPESQTRAGSSLVGVAIQVVAFFCVAFGPMRIRFAPDSLPALIEGVVVGPLMLLTVGLFVAASRAMGKNWAIVARTRSDHQLVTSGPFAWIRHPIYVALFAYLIALAVAFGHWRGLILGVPLYWIGVWIRIRQEERLLRAQFGAAYDAYAARVKRFVPGVI